MNIFCCYIKEELSKRFRIEVDVFVSKNKELIPFTFSRPLTNMMKLLILLRVDQGKTIFFFVVDYKMIYPRLNHSMRWRSG